MKTTRQNGFVLIFVIVIIAITAVVMSLLAGDANTMLFQSDTAYLRAADRNLTASGLAWAAKNIREQNEAAFDKSIELDVANMKIRDAALSITISAPTAKTPEAQIKTSCSRGRQTLRRKGKYEIKL